MHCIIEAMIGADSGVQLLHPVADGVPDIVCPPSLTDPRPYIVSTLAQSITLVWPHMAALRERWSLPAGATVPEGSAVEPLCMLPSCLFSQDV